jgi:ABC-type multidrug transport system fused ATPase/permease subunit
VNTVVQGTLLLVGIYLIERGNVTSEVLLAFMLYQGQLQNEMMNLFNSYSSLIKSSGAGDKVFQILDRVPPPPATGSLQVQSLEGNSTVVNPTPVAIRFENVHFSYPSRPQQPILRGIDLAIDPGTTVALVGKLLCFCSVTFETKSRPDLHSGNVSGPSGCGKSTIINLLQRYYDVSSGAVKIDDVDIQSIDLKCHRRRIGIVTQDPTLFSGTILSNITYGMPGATKDMAIDAAIRSNAHDFICAMPEGYETEVRVCLSVLVCPKHDIDCSIVNDEILHDIGRRTWFEVEWRTKTKVC